jgi:hypothetical protein
MPNAAWSISWRPGRIRVALPIVVHCVAMAAVICVAAEYAAAWLLGCIVLYSAIHDARSLRVERAQVKTLTLHGQLVALDGIAAHVERGWLGPGLTVVWLRMDARRERVAVFRSELDPADHAALRRHLRELDF